MKAKLLFDDLLINVTDFFRDPEVWSSAKIKAFPQLLQHSGVSGPIRAWVPGCATGEEVYSLAMALVEFFTKQDEDFPIQVFGTDVSEAVIARARSEVYDANAMLAVSSERRRRFFVRSDGSYQISQQIRELCIFSRHNVASDPPAIANGIDQLPQPADLFYSAIATTGFSQFCLRLA